MKVKSLLYKKLHFLLSIAIVTSLLLTMTSCLPSAAVKKIAAFSDGVDIAMKNTITAYETIEGRHHDRKVAEVVNSYNVATNIEQVKIPRFIPEEDWKQRKLVIDGLRLYATNLKAVVSDDKLQEFDAKTKALGQQLASLNENTVKQNILNSGEVPASGIQIFTTAINAIGRWFIDYKREKIVKQTVNKMKENVRNVCLLFGQEIGYNAPVKNGSLVTTQRGTLRKKLWRDYSQIMMEQNDFLVRNEANFSANDKRKEIEKLLSLKDEREQADETLDAVVKALRAIPEAHNNIEKAFDEKDTTLPGLISKIFEEGERIKDFYEGLKKK